MKDLKHKMKNYSFWTALFSALVILIGSISKAFGLSLDSGLAEEIIMGICGVLVAVGLVGAKSDSSSAYKNNDGVEGEIVNEEEAESKNELVESMPNKDCQTTPESEGNATKE